MLPFTGKSVLYIIISTMRIRFRPYLLVLIPAVCLLTVLCAAGAYNLPPVHDRLAWRIDNWRAQIKYALNPPENVVFVPQEPVATIVEATMQAMSRPSATPTATSTPVPAGPTATPQPSPSPTISPTPLPILVNLKGVKYEDQHNRWNYCGPANLSMALTFWGWDGNRDVVGKAIKPSDKDKNVMPYEMVDFVTNDVPGIGALLRSGGDIDLIRRMVANGFPVLAEKGYYEYDYNGKLGWMGHYQYVTGYDDTQGTLLVQDTYNDGPNHAILYPEFIKGWRDFNYVFIITYPLERQAEVLNLLGPYADANWSYRHAWETAQEETQRLTGNDQFFAWFNVGTSLVNLADYGGAAAAYDTAFQVYAQLPEDPVGASATTRPYRMMWYQTGPYFAYYYSARYQDVINLADNTLLKTISEPVLEESLYWRAMAKAALGDTGGAIQDLQDSLKWHPGFQPSVAKLQELGVNP